MDRTANQLEYAAPAVKKPVNLIAVAKTAALAAATLVVLIVFLAAFLSYTDNGSIADRNLAKGEQIVKALERYKATHTAYPPTLDALVPSYIYRLPQPERAEWMYFPEDGGSRFGLFFQSDDAPVGHYNSTSKIWDVDTQ